MQPMLTTEEVAEGLRVETVTVRRLVARGEIEAYRVGSEYRFRLADIDKYLARQRIDAGTGDATERPETLTARARTVLTLAQDEAARLNHAYVGTEHLLLGLIAEGKNIVAKVLDSRGIDLDRVRTTIERLMADRPDRPDQPKQRGREDINLAPRARKAFAAAADEAVRRGQGGNIAPEHLFLGLLCEGKEGIAGGVLVDLGVDLEQVREQTIQAVWKS
jgi:excisionase family DNA binding protein